MLQDDSLCFSVRFIVGEVTPDAVVIAPPAKLIGLFPKKSADLIQFFIGGNPISRESLTSDGVKLQLLNLIVARDHLGKSRAPIGFWRFNDE
jgi:hypothetical protein